MRAFLLPLLLTVGACAAPPASEPPPPALPEAPPRGEPLERPAFDAAAWLEAVAVAETGADREALASDLLGPADWRAACGEDDPTAEGRGEIRLAPVAEDRVLAEVTCERLPLGRAFALVDLEPGRHPRLVRAFGIDDGGLPTADASAGFFGVPSYPPDGGPGFEVLTPAASGSGCGLWVRYRLRPDGGAAVVRVRAYENCAAPRPAEDWPETYAPD